MSARAGLFTSRPGFAGSQLNLWRELACIAVIFMELSWITPWYMQLIAPTTGATPGRVFAVFFLILIGAYLETRLVESLPMAVRLRLVFFSIYFLVSALFGLKYLFYFSFPFGLWGSLLHLLQVIRQIDVWIPREFTGIFAFFLVTLSGVRLALDPPEPYRVFRYFVIGAGMMILLGLIYITVPAWISTGMLALFLASSLFAMCAARFALLGHLRGSQRIPFNRQRLLEIGVFTVVLAGLSLLASALVRAPAPFQVLYEIASYAFRALLLIVALIMSPVYLIMILLFPNIHPSPEIASILGLLSQILNELRALFANLLRGLFNIRFDWILAHKTEIQVGILLLIALLIFLWACSLYLRKRKDTMLEADRNSQEESFDSLYRPGWRNPFLFLLDRFGRWLDGNSRRQSLAAERIRQIYTELCKRAAQLGRPRMESQTPLEYLLSLEKLFPGQQEDLEVITQAYLRVRYGELPETQEQVNVVISAWARLSAASRSVNR